MSERVSYDIDGHFFIIKLNDAKHLNSLTFEDFVYIALLLKKANDIDSVIFTVLQSSGKYFSAGGKFSAVNELNGEECTSEVEKISKLVSAISSPNIFVANAFATHKKILICCLNGPAVGLSASLVALCDIVYSRNDSVFLLFPFSNLGFVAEVGTSVTLTQKLGVNSANEHLIFSSPVLFKELLGTIVTKNYQISDTDTFNETVLEDLKQHIEGLYTKSILGMKELLHSQMKEKLIKSQAMETNGTLPFWASGEPFKRFQQLQKGNRRHKL
ncbi:dci1p [Saccharomyces arboricola H-6]|uniref:Dci1p n=1 Tax=Saccharomyces arboricola (strain H-6 / AS 2.3317 / CBS 10644) TaxID=1160507 RepID=J8PHR0_SACAR|nr:dci1p [Saccharomyces arboricola H-6]